jgi:hypothetical protein
MRFWKRSSHVAPLFQANDDSILDDHVDHLANSRHVPSPSSSLCSSCSASICLASDPMREEKSEINPSAAHNQSVCGIAVDDLYIGDMISDEEGVDWIVRQCFCETAQCCGKTFKRLEGKEELDVWDRGRPAS